MDKCRNCSWCEMSLNDLFLFRGETRYECRCEEQENKEDENCENFTQREKPIPKEEFYRKWKLHMAK